MDNMQNERPDPISFVSFAYPVPATAIFIISPD